MSPYYDWSQVIVDSFANMWSGVIANVPNILVALIIFIIGWVVGVVVGRWVSDFFTAIKIDRFFHSLGAEEVAAQAGYRFSVGGFVGAVVKWFVILSFLVASINVLHLDQVNAFLIQILNYLPHVIVAALILIIAAVIADALQKIVAASVAAAGISSANLFGTVIKWVIWIFAIMAALDQVQILNPFIDTIFTGIVVAISIAVGLALGLGGQDAASDLINKVRDELGSARKRGK